MRLYIQARDAAMGERGSETLALEREWQDSSPPVFLLGMFTARLVSLSCCALGDSCVLYLYHHPHGCPFQTLLSS